MAVYIKIWRKF